MSRPSNYGLDARRRGALARRERDLKRLQENHNDLFENLQALSPDKPKKGKPKYKDNVKKTDKPLRFTDLNQCTEHIMLSSKRIVALEKELSNIRVKLS